MGDMIDRDAALAIEGQLAKSMAHFLRVEQWQAYKAGVQEYRDAIAALEPVTQPDPADEYPYDAVEQCERDLDGIDPDAIREAALRKVADKVYAKLSAKGLYAEAQSARDTILALLEKPHDRA